MVVGWTTVGSTNPVERRSVAVYTPIRISLIHLNFCPPACEFEVGFQPKSVEQTVASQIYSKSSFKRVVELPVWGIPNVALVDPLLFKSGKMASLGKVYG